MKKLFILIVSMLFGTYLSASYVHTITNNTKSHIRTKVNLKDQPDKNFTLKPDEIRKVDVSDSCTRALEAEGLDGEATGIQARQDLEGTGCIAIDASIEYDGAAPGIEKKLNLNIRYLLPPYL